MGRIFFALAARPCPAPEGDREAG
eukprot:COSAG06_NODE_60666_length_270_cov_0.602339_1_plen_23_part_10